MISKVYLRAIEGKREWLHHYCYSFRRDQLLKAQDALMQLVKSEVVYDIHFTDRWQYHWPMEEGLYQKSRIPDDAWFFLKSVVMARDDEELAFKEKRMRLIYESAGAIDVPQIAEKSMGAKAQEHGLHGWPDCHVMGPNGWCGAVVRHSGMFAVTSKIYPLAFLKEMYDLDEAAKRSAVYGTPNIHRSTIAMLAAIWQSKKNTLFFRTHTTMKMSASCESGWLWSRSSMWGGLDRAHP